MEGNALDVNRRQQGRNRNNPHARRGVRRRVILDDQLRHRTLIAHLNRNYLLPKGFIKSCPPWVMKFIADHRGELDRFIWLPTKAWYDQIPPELRISKKKIALKIPAQEATMMVSLLVRRYYFGRIKVLPIIGPAPTVWIYHTLLILDTLLFDQMPGQAHTIRDVLIPAIFKLDDQMSSIDDDCQRLITNYNDAVDHINQHGANGVAFNINHDYLPLDQLRMQVLAQPVPFVNRGGNVAVVLKNAVKFKRDLDRMMVTYLGWISKQRASRQNVGLRLLLLRTCFLHHKTSVSIRINLDNKPFLAVLLGNFNSFGFEEIQLIRGMSRIYPGLGNVFAAKSPQTMARAAVAAMRGQPFTPEALPVMPFLTGVFIAEIATTAPRSTANLDTRGAETIRAADRDARNIDHILPDMFGAHEGVQAPALMVQRDRAGLVGMMIPMYQGMEVLMRRHEQLINEDDQYIEVDDYEDQARGEELYYHDLQVNGGEMAQQNMFPVEPFPMQEYMRNQGQPIPFERVDDALERAPPPEQDRNIRPGQLNVLQGRERGLRREEFVEQAHVAGNAHGNQGGAGGNIGGVGRNRGGARGNQGGAGGNRGGEGGNRGGAPAPVRFQAGNMFGGNQIEPERYHGPGNIGRGENMDVEIANNQPRQGNQGANQGGAGQEEQEIIENELEGQAIYSDVGSASSGDMNMDDLNDFDIVPNAREILREDQQIVEDANGDIQFVQFEGMEDVEVAPPNHHINIPLRADVELVRASVIARTKRSKITGIVYITTEELLNASRRLDFARVRVANSALEFQELFGAAMATINRFAHSFNINIIEPPTQGELEIFFDVMTRGQEHAHINILLQSMIGLPALMASESINNPDIQAIMRTDHNVIPAQYNLHIYDSSDFLAANAQTFFRCESPNAEIADLIITSSDILLNSDELFTMYTDTYTESFDVEKLREDINGLFIFVQASNMLQHASNASKLSSRRMNRLHIFSTVMHFFGSLISARHVTRISKAFLIIAIIATHQVILICNTMLFEAAYYHIEADWLWVAMSVLKGNPIVNSMLNAAAHKNLPDASSFRQEVDTMNNMQAVDVSARYLLASTHPQGTNNRRMFVERMLSFIAETNSEAGVMNSSRLYSFMSACSDIIETGLVASTAEARFIEFILGDGGNPLERQRFFCGRDLVRAASAGGEFNDQGFVMEDGRVIQSSTN
jgi:hypothetical protein